jgi:hypothetical protein
LGYTFARVSAVVTLRVEDYPEQVAVAQTDEFAK